MKQFSKYLRSRNGFAKSTLENRETNRSELVTFWTLQAAAIFLVFASIQTAQAQPMTSPPIVSQEALVELMNGSRKQNIPLALSPQESQQIETLTGIVELLQARSSQVLPQLGSPYQSEGLFIPEGDMNLILRVLDAHILATMPPEKKMAVEKKLTAAPKSLRLAVRVRFLRYIYPASFSEL